VKAGGYVLERLPPHIRLKRIAFEVYHEPVFAHGNKGERFLVSFVLHSRPRIRRFGYKVERVRFNRARPFQA